MQPQSQPGRVAPRLRRLLVLSLLVAGASACRSTPKQPDGPHGDVAAVAETIERLYTAFCFDPGAEPDWETQRELFLDGAIFVAPIQPGQSPVPMGVEEFVADFRSFATGRVTAATGFHERILDKRIGVFGTLAHAYVRFEGFHPAAPDQPVTRGIDSIQFVRDGAHWRLLSFTTQYDQDAGAQAAEPPAGAPTGESSSGEQAPGAGS